MKAFHFPLYSISDLQPGLWWCLLDLGCYQQMRNILMEAISSEGQSTRSKSTALVYNLVKENKKMVFKWHVKYLHGHWQDLWGIRLYSLRIDQLEQWIVPLVPYPQIREFQAYQQPPQGHPELNPCHLHRCGIFLGWISSFWLCTTKLRSIINLINNLEVNQ